MALYGNVNLIDPNNINNKYNHINGIPQYQDMYIFVELLAYGQQRTVLVKSSSNVGYDYYSEKTRTISLLGYTDNASNKYDGYYTTNYYYGSESNDTVYNGFGITDINIKINASQIPQIKIRFVDIRGVSFFNDKNSPYRIIFDFPPPIFKLTIKGYYGKSITYLLHLTNYKSSFDSKSGNFNIDADFVAVTFAPLSDVLFRYVVNFALLNKNQQSNSDSNIEPKNTDDLIIKLKNVYNGISKLKNNDDTYKNYDSINKSLNNISEIFKFLNGCYFNENLKKFGNVYKIIRMYKQNFFEKNSVTLQNNNTNNNINFLNFNFVDYGKIPDFNYNNDYDFIIKKINDINEYNQYIENNSIQQLCIVLIDNNDSNINNGIKNFIADINRFPSCNIDNNDIVRFKGDINLDNDNIISTNYVGINITKLYKKLYNEYNNNINNQKKAIDNISKKINDIYSRELGMKPTIYNIFKIILDDVDNFFDILRETSIDAEQSHNSFDKPDSSIVKFSGDGTNSNTNSRIYAFPLIIDNQQRVAPTKLYQKGIKFPEIDLILNFIETFQYQNKLKKELTMKNIVNDDNVNIWIPICPFDTLQYCSSKSPYYDVNSIDKIYEIVLLRYYLITQFIYYNYFKDGKPNGIVDRFLEYFPAADALNLANAITNEKLAGKLKNDAVLYKDDINKFFSYIKNLKISSEIIKSIDINNYNINNNSNDINKFYNIIFNYYNNRNNSNIRAWDVIYEVDEQDIESLNLDNIFKKLYENVNNSWYEFWKKRVDLLFDLKYTKNNIFYISDLNDDNEYKSRFINITRYKSSLDGFEKISLSSGTDVRISYIFDVEEEKLPNTLMKALSNGNLSFGVVDKYANTYKNTFMLTDEIKEYINDNNNDNFIKALLLVSLFGNIVSPFNKYSNNLNSTIFKLPSIIQMPRTVILYMGALIYAKFNNKLDDIIIMISKTNLNSRGVFILADYKDVNNYLSESDKDYIFEQFEIYYKSEFEDNLKELKIYINDLNYNKDNKNYNYYDSDSFKKIKEVLTKKVYLVNNYSMVIGNDTNYNFIPIIDKIKNNDDVTTKYFNNFFKTLYNEINNIVKKIENDSFEEQKIKSDLDVINQTYYSFKNINDKWLTTGISTQGYPFNSNGKRLIDMFAFVDRAMNPVDDTIINCECLIDMLDSPNISVYSVLSQLLSSNGFEFFPIQNFLSFKNDEWENSFKIYTNPIDLNINTFFVCMYIGGYSRHVSIPTNNFEPDGIIDFEKDITDDYKRNDTKYGEYTANTNFPYQNVYAFKVGFGEQNQSMFIDIDIDSREYKDTNESIQILSRLAGDNKNNAPIPKGQNLYNLYENRSYKATITALGNAMIQPTQYFQLENVPLFNGAYIILDVEHNITPNKMITKFSGTKILKYPIPRVLDPIAFTSIDDSLSKTSSGEFTVKISNIENMLKLKSMYYLKIR